ncbi:hypothetical protein [Agitococcus lubricus]|uniref:Uncharacterized protein n=1 Tax=Agitococcus lubricus TaxID=1077255 RepID=A0A2T5ISA7_9GAMM|nr:hypothetical protein [Agitococcus lubricus]PTQ86697.1 hypothetical protein C8N29_13610 [Agitococcus lubricus]
MPVSVYGFIEGFTNGVEDAHNLLQLQALPEIGTYLTKCLFSFVPQSKFHAYYGSHIHFAAGYKEFYGLNEEWLKEFESLLSNLYWSKAEIILTWSKECYLWSSDYSSDRKSEAPNKIVSRTRFESAWELKEIPWDS